MTVPRELRNKKYIFDLDFFEKIDTPNKAYMLGFIYGDGSLRDDVLSIEISSKDEYILDIFRNILGPKPPLIKRRKRIRNGTKTYSSSIQICGRVFVNHLFNIGLMKNKATKITYPNIEYHYDFIRGLSDSDGCISIDKQNRASWSLISSESMCGSVCNILNDTGICAKVFESRNDGLNYVTLTRKSDIIKLRYCLYYENCICLKRKRDKFFDVHYKIKSKWSTGVN